jgi:zinc protease
MKFTIISFILFVFISIQFISCSKTRTVHTGDYTYETVDGDPLKARIYTLDNGLKVYLTVYKDAPRIQTCIPVRVGSKNDPADNTGLAHYLEHLMFKGTDEFGSSDFEKEKPLLDEIVQLYDVYSQENDTLIRKKIYEQIDSISYIASKYAIASEYDKMLSLIGASGTNAYTGSDLTCYVNEIPSNHIRQWLKIEVERFRNPVFRLFHTELEVVYEEKNRAMDDDNRKKWEALFAGIWPTHPYGTQTTLGKREHLKNPSLQTVYDYYYTYYVPNNMAICLSGDFNPDSMIVMVDETFGSMKAKEVSKWQPPIEQPITQPVEKEVLGPDMESIIIGYRFPGVNSKEAELLLITDFIMMNSVAGIIDLNLKQKQLVISPYSGTYIRPDYSMHYFGARPREGQSMQEVRDLLLAQIDSLKAGAFPDWLPGAVIRDLKRMEIKGYESNGNRADAFVDAFINDQKWEDVVHKWDFRYSITKNDIIEFAKKYYGDNYVVVNKKTGEDPNVVKIKKPPITSVEVNREAQSDFLKVVEKMEVPAIQPVFVNFEKDVTHLKMKKEIPVLYKQNEENELFSLHFISDLGTFNNRKFGIALDYLTFLGTSKYSSEEFKQEMYKLGCSFGAWSSNDQLRVYFSGLNESFDQGFKLFEHLLADVQPDDTALANLVKDVLKRRSDSKLNKSTILRGAMVYYGIYGKDSPYRYILSEEELNALTPQELITIIKQVFSFNHRVLYYGPLSEEEIVNKLNTYHKVHDTFQDIPVAKEFIQLPTTKDLVYVCNYDMEQAEIMMISKSVPFNKNNVAIRSLFNEYYGGNMSSIVFQTLRESQGLAYSVWASYQTPNKPEEAHYIRSYIGTQADKIREALNGMSDLLNNMAKSQKLFESSKDGIIRRIQTERITKESILWRYENEKRMGTDDRDYRQDVYSQISDMTMEELQHFFDEYIKDKQYTILVLGDVRKLNFDILKSYGSVKQLSLEEVFGY